jgi:Pyrimidine dimer DNA glycosylase
LPYARFNKCAYCLDNKRLFKQAVECKQILLALGVPVGAHRPTGSKAWTNHPAVRMWRGHELALAIYSAHIAEEARRRRYRSNLLSEFLSVVRARREPGKPARYPPWMRDWSIMTSHRSNLLRKDKDWYSQFGWLVKPDLPYKWPVPNENDRDE